MSARVFLGYDQAGLDLEYDNRRKVPDFQDYLDHWTASSARTRAQLDCRLGVAYGPGPAETVDIFPASGSGKAPVHLFIHGGYWTKLSRNEFSFVANGLLPAGVCTAVMDYGLIPAVDMREQVRQCRACLAWLVRNAASYGGDPERVYVSGHSAGGHLAAMLLTTDWPGFDPGLPTQPIKGAVGISGLYDLEPIRLCFLNEGLGLTEASAAVNSPCRLERRTDCPLLLTLGSLEGPEYLRQSRTLARAWMGDGDPLHPTELAGRQHFSIVTELDDPDSELTRMLANQMGQGR